MNDQITLDHPEIPRLDASDRAFEGPVHSRIGSIGQLSVLQVDPSLFTAPYDAALSDGLNVANVRAVWATRRLRSGEDDYLTGTDVLPIFYPFTDGPRRRPRSIRQKFKGLEHALGLRRLTHEAAKFDLVHFQWAPVPWLDRRAARAIGRSRPVVITAHDIEPFNGRSVSMLQRRGYDAMIATADRVIVHTEAGRTALVSRGIPEHRIDVVAHGNLPLAPSLPEPQTDDRWRVLLFGRIQDYKGADVLIEALGLIEPSVRERLEVVVAGEILMPIEPLQERAAVLGLGSSLVLRPGRLADAEMSALLRSADAFVFPYRSIDASGVLHLVAGLKRWIIASDLGAFRAMIGDDQGAGSLVQPSDAAALAKAVVASIGRRPTRQLGLGIPSWAEIGAATRAVYESALAERASR